MDVGTHMCGKKSHTKMLHKPKKVVFILFILSTIILPLECIASTDTEPTHDDERSIRSSRRLLSTSNSLELDVIFKVIIPIVVMALVLIIRCCMWVAAQTYEQMDETAVVHPPPRRFTHNPSVPVPHRGNPLRPPRAESSTPIIPSDNQNRVLMVRVISIENPNYFERNPVPPEPSEDLPPSYESVLRHDQMDSQRVNFNQRY